MKIGTWRVGGEVTQRIANPCGFLAKSTTYHTSVIKTKRKQGVNLITALFLAACDRAMSSFKADVASAAVTAVCVPRVAK